MNIHYGARMKGGMTYQNAHPISVKETFRRIEIVGKEIPFLNNKSPRGERKKFYSPR